MRRTERVRYEMLLRVRGFGIANRDRFPESSTGGQAFATVAQAIVQIDAHTTTKPLTAKDGREAMAIARAAIRDRMRIVARTGRGLRRAPGAAGHKLLMPQRVSDVALLAAARGFLSEAEAHKDQLVRLGLPATCLPELLQAVNDLEVALGERRAGRAGVAGAQAGIAAALTLGVTAVHTLDIVVPNTLEQDPVLFAEWQRHRRVVEVRSKRTSELATSGEAPTDPLRRAS